MIDMRISEFLTYLFCPPKCASCGDTLGLSFLDAPLCGKCLDMLDGECAEICGRCKKHMYECTCSEDSILSGGCLFHTKLSLYHGGKLEKAINGIVFEMKRSSDMRLYRFLADRLYDRSREAIERAVKMCGAEKAVITCVPRSKEALIRYGHDQAELLAYALSEKLCIPFVSVAARKKNTNKKMKSLTYEERFTEAENTYVPSKDLSSLEGVFVIIVDDVVTSGASVLAVSRIAMKNKARGFGVISVGISKQTGAEKYIRGAKN